MEDASVTIRNISARMILGQLVAYWMKASSSNTGFLSAIFIAASAFPQPISINTFGIFKIPTNL
jgi:hypothetical protein